MIQVLHHIDNYDLILYFYLIESTLLFESPMDKKSVNDDTNNTLPETMIKKMKNQMKNLDFLGCIILLRKKIFKIDVEEQFQIMNGVKKKSPPLGLRKKDKKNKIKKKKKTLLGFFL